VSTTTPDTIKAALEQARELAHTPDIERDEALGKLLHNQHASVWGEPVLLDYCAQHFDVSAEDLRDASRKIQRAKQQGRAASVCLYQATQPGVTTPLAGVVHKALEHYWWQNMRQWLPGSMGFPTVESSDAWSWGVEYGLKGQARAAPVDYPQSLHGARCYTAVFKTPHLVLRVCRDESVQAHVLDIMVRQWEAELLTPDNCSETLKQILGMERKGMGWLSAHLELGALARERKAADLVARFPHSDSIQRVVDGLDVDGLMRVVHLLRVNADKRWWAGDHT
jgi:hypothetical protein